MPEFKVGDRVRLEGVAVEERPPRHPIKREEPESPKLDVKKPMRLKQTGEGLRYVGNVKGWNNIFAVILPDDEVIMVKEQQVENIPESKREEESK